MSGCGKAERPRTFVRMTELPWKTVHVDFHGPLHTSEYLLVVVDRYSRFPEDEIAHSTRASTVVPKHDKIFSVLAQSYLTMVLPLMETSMYGTSKPLVLKLNSQHLIGLKETLRWKRSCNRWERHTRRQN